MDMSRLEEEGDIAADYLEDLLDIADLDGDLDISVEADRPTVAIIAEGGADRKLRRLIGRNGEVLDALQELTRLAVQNETGDRCRLMLDIDGYREAHRQEIAAIAREAIATVEETGEDYSLEPMNPFERKVVHDLAAAAGFVSESEGVGPGRHVIIRAEELDDDESGESADSAESGESPASADSAESAESAASAGSAASADEAEDEAE